VTPSSTERHRDRDIVSRELLRLSNRGGQRTAFLLELSAILFRATHTTTVELWLDDRVQVLIWRCRRADPDRFELRTARSGDLARPLIEACLAAATGELEQPPRPSRQTDRGTVLIGGAGPTAEVALIPLVIDDRQHGVLRMDHATTDPDTIDVEELEHLAELVGIAVANRRSQAALAERVKELDCMYRIAQIGAEITLPLERMLQEIVELLPPAWQYPEIATARITLDGNVFESRDFAEGPHRLLAAINVWGSPRGRVEVFYGSRPGRPTSEPLFEEWPFLEEELHLIDGVARELASIIERKHADEEKSRLREQLRHADRLATIGQLAAGVAHELNEPLANILGFAQLALKGSDLPAQARTDLERIVNASLYSREVIKKLMFFARQTPSQEGEVCLNTVVEESLSLLASRCEKAGLLVTRALAPAIPPVRGDRAQLQQVLVNLVVNAIQAMGDGGTLTVATSATETSVELAVEDTGSGIAATDLDRIFLPFFTTKEIGEGTGLGLSVVHGIVTAHDGTVHVDSKIGRGTRFVVTLPRDDASRREEPDRDR